VYEQGAKQTVHVEGLEILTESTNKIKQSWHEVQSNRSVDSVLSI
jgi:hypothetical protein